ncbi:hypothetical protein AGDE_08169, partial [Angomonas deanei]
MDKGDILTEKDAWSKLNRLFFPLCRNTPIYSDNMSKCHATDRSKATLFNSVFASMHDSSPGLTELPVDPVTVPSVTVWEVTHALRKLRNSGSADHVGLHPCFVKVFLGECRKQTAEAFTQLLRHPRDMPPHWKTAVFCPILKPGKPPTEATSYRPVAITSLVCRTFERVVSRRLMSFLHDKLSPVQFGFRPGYSTEDAIARVYGTLVKMANTRSVKYIERPNKKGTIVTSGKFTGHVSILGLLDLKDAFCRVPHKHLLDALALLQVPDYIMSIVAHWLTGRTSRTCVQGRYSSSLVLPCGSLKVQYWVLY